MSSEELRLFDKIRVFLDEDYSSAEHFTVSKKQLIKMIKDIYFIMYKITNFFFVIIHNTYIFQALGNFYFVHESLKNVLLWDFQGMT